MAAARNLLRRYYDSYGGLFIEPGWEEKVSVTSGLMTEEEGRQEANTSTSTTTTATNDIGVDDQYSHKGWLQLGASHPVELNLFPERPPTIASAAAENIRESSTILEGSEQYAYQPVGSSSLPVASGRELRVISPPGRRRSGLWLELRAARDQGKEPFLPQIPKSYLRIKDDSMTVGLLMKYLANKMGFDGESQIEIACRGQWLHPTMTLQNIRDNVWCTRSTALVMRPQDSQISDHVITLTYSRRA